MIANPVSSKVILLVDDDPTNLLVFARLLHREGYRVIEACNGEEALNAVAEHTDIECVVSDVFMPNMRGDELAHELSCRYPNLKIILMSADPGMLQTLAHANVHAFPLLDKTLGLAELRNQLHSIMG